MIDITIFGREIRYGARKLLRERGFTLAAVTSLALGIAAATAVFSVVYGAILNPFPYRDVAGLYTPRIQNLKTPAFRPMFSEAESRGFTASGIFSETMKCGFEQALWTGDGEPDSVRTVLMSGSAFEFLGVPPLLGRTFNQSDVPEGRAPEPVVVLSYAQWQHKFGGDPKVLNRKVLLNGKPYVVIGVMPPRFTWFGRESVWIPDPVEGRQTRLYQFRVRLKRGVSVESASERLQVIAQALAAERPAAFPREGFKVTLVSMKDSNVGSGNLQKSLTPLVVAVGLLVLIACSNVANLLLARATGQRREIAIRAAMGAGRSRIIRQALVQSLMLSVGGAAAGAGLAGVCLRSIVSLIPSQNLPDEAVISLNPTVLLFCMGLAVATGLLFGIAPAIQALRVDPQEALKDAGRGHSDARGGKLRSALVVAELALSMFLLTAAAFTLRSFTALETTELGFRTDGVLVARLPLPRARYGTPEKLNAFYDQALERLSTMPQVKAVSASVGGVPSIFMNGTLRGNSLAPGDTRIGVSFISADYFRVLSIPLRKGRFASSDEVRRGDRVAVINEAAAKQFWKPGDDPFNGTVTLSTQGNPPWETTATIIGVAGDTKNQSQFDPTRPAIFLPATIAPPAFRLIAMQVQGRPEGSIASVRRALHELDPALPMADTVTLDTDMEYERVGPRFMMVLLLFFAAIGLVLAACGTYGVMSYSVSRRTYEFGIRMALGAQRGDVAGSVVWGGMRLAAVGVALGLAATLVVARLYRGYISQSTYLRNFDENDPVAIAVVVVALLVTAVMACYVPARRAAAADPAQSLRCE